MADRADILFRAEVDATGAITALRALDDQTQRAGKGAATATTGMAGFGESVMSLKQTIAGAAVAAGLYKLTDWLSETVKLAGEAQVEQVKLEAMLRATGGAVGLTATQLDAMASSLSRATGIDDELVKSAESLLLTFRNVGSQAFGPTMKAAADLAAVTGMDLRMAVETLGRALEDPAIGMDRLRRAGIIFSDQVRAQIKDLEAHGQQLKAQQLLLSEVQARVGGLSDAMGGTFLASLEKVKTEWSNVREEIGGFLTDSKGGVGVLADLATVLGKIADEIKGAKGEDRATGQAAGGGMFSLLTSMVPGMGGAAANVETLATALGLAAVKIHEADAAATKLVSSHAALGASAGNVARMSDEEKKKLDALLNAFDPVRKATADYNENVKLLNEALAAGEITQGQYNGALKASKEALDKVLASSRNLLPEMEKLPGTNVLKGLGHWADAIRDVDENFRQLLPKVTSLANASAAGLPYTRWILDLDLSNAKKQALNFSDETAKQFSSAFKDGFLSVFEGKDVASAWETLSRGFAGIFAKQLGDTVAALMQGRKLTGEGGALEAGGLWSKETGFNWTGLLGGVGGMVGSYGMAKNNQAMGALGGAMSGAAAGSKIWPGWGTLIGAVIGGVAGYFGSAGQRDYTENWGASSGANPPSDWQVKWQNNLAQGNLYASSGVSKGGTSQSGLASMTQQIFEQSQNVEAALNQMLLGMKQSLQNPAWTTVFKGSSTDVAADFNLFLKGQLPEKIFKAFTPYLKAGMGSMGISEGRVAQEITTVATASDFSKAIQQLQAYLTAVTSLRDLSKDLGATAGELRDKVNATARDQYLQGFSTAMDQIQQISGALEGMTSAQQVANAQQILSMAQSEYQAGLQYFSQLESLSKGLSTSYGDTFAGFNEQRAREKGTAQLAGYYESQINSLMDQLAKAGSAEQVQTINQKLQQYGTSLWQLQGGENQPRGMYSRTDIEAVLRQAEKESQDKIAAWEKEVADKNAALKDQIDTMTTALTSATTSLATTTTDLNDLGDVAGKLGDQFDQLGGAAGAFAEALSGATAEAVAALGDLAASAGSAHAAVQRYA